MAKKIKTRISQQLNTVKLMMGIQNSSAGKRILIIGELYTKPGQVVEKVLRITESALIEHSLTQGYIILNKRGTKRPTHNINFTGNRDAKNYSGKVVMKRA